MTDREISIDAGYHGNYLAEVKHRDPEKYDAMRILGINGYESYANSLRSQLGDMYWRIKDDPELSFSELYRNYCPDATSSIHGFTGYIRKVAFANIVSSNQYRAVKRMEYILSSYEKYIKDKKDG